MSCKAQGRHVSGGGSAAMCGPGPRRRMGEGHNRGAQSTLVLDGMHMVPMGAFFWGT